MSIAQFMQEVLANPAKGYYTTKEKVIGAPGDFVTSPEISQMFGESICIWIVHEWKKMGQVQPLNLVELGPGHGTLMFDVLKTMKALVPKDMEHVKVHFVETSSTLSKIQEAKLCGYERREPRLTKQGVPVSWYSHVGQVPKGFTFFLANEFFDALPIHKFVRDPESKALQEILVDVNEKGDLALKRAKQRTLANIYADEVNDDLEAVEISPKSGVIMETIANRIVEYGGAALIADYGYDVQDGSNHRDTFRAFFKHKLVDPLENVGQADLTADVDFDYLKSKSCKDTLAYGPVPQAQFLTQLGIQIRCNLLKDHNPKLADDLDQSLDMLINPEKMGKRFKFFALFPKTMEKIHAEYPPVGFYKGQK